MLSLFFSFYGKAQVWEMTYSVKITIEKSFPDACSEQRDEVAIILTAKVNIHKIASKWS